MDGLLEAGGAPSKERRREEVVARYWQRYCAKNDTIGFFGPLAWGELRDDGPALTQHSRGLVRERTVHIETWCLERFLQAFTDDPWLPLGAAVLTWMLFRATALLPRRTRTRACCCRSAPRSS